MGLGLGVVGIRVCCQCLFGVSGFGLLGFRLSSCSVGCRKVLGYLGLGFGVQGLGFLGFRVLGVSFTSRDDKYHEPETTNPKSYNCPDP